MAVVTEGKYAGDWLKWEQDNLYSREVVTILAGSGAARVLTSGMVMGKVTASGKWIQYDDTAANGAQNAAGVLLLNTTAPDGTDVKATIIIRDAIISDNGITWPSTADAGEKTTALAALKALGIVTGEGA